MFDPTKPVQTRDGRKAVIYTTEGITQSRPIVGEIWNVGTEEGEVRRWLPDGKYTGNPNYEKLDLINVPEKIKLTGWVNVYDGGYFTLHQTRKSADTGQERLACISVEDLASGKYADGVPVGEGLDD